MKKDLIYKFDLTKRLSVVFDSSTGLVKKGPVSKINLKNFEVVASVGSYLDSVYTLYSGRNCTILRISGNLFSNDKYYVLQVDGQVINNLKNIKNGKN
jgi:hypothetical protein